MIVRCTREEVEKVIKYCHDRQIVFLSIVKDNGKFTMQYDLLEEIAKRKLNPESFIENIDQKLKKSVKTLSEVIEKLEIFKNLCDYPNVSFGLTFDCTNTGVQPVYKFSSTIPSGLNVSERKNVSVDWDTVFADRLEENVPGIYFKKTAKKYSPVTYKELIGILKS